jgi:hypothetical protein
MINYNSLLYNLKIASFEDISTSSSYTTPQKKVIYRTFITFLKNINKYPSAFSRLIDLFKKAKESKSETDPFHKNTYDPLKYTADYIKKCIENYLQTESGLDFVGTDTSLKKEDITDEQISKLREESQTQKKKELQEMKDKGKKKRLTVPQDELNALPTPTSKELSGITTKSLNKSKFVDQSIVDKAMGLPEEEGGEDVDYIEEEEEPVDIRIQKHKRHSNEDSLIKIAIELLQEDYTLFGTLVLPAFFKLWLESYGDKIIEQSNLTKEEKEKVEHSDTYKKTETTDATGAPLKVGDSIKLIPTFSGEDKDNAVFTVTDIINKIDDIEQDPTKRLDFISYMIGNDPKNTKVEPHYMVIKVDTNKSEAIEEDLILHQAIYDVLSKMAIDLGIVQKNVGNLNPGEISEATGPDNTKLQVSKDTEGNISVKDEKTTEPPITVSKETAPQLDETLRQKNINLVQNQV